MSIANAAFRLSAAGIIISDVIRNVNLDSNKGITDIWPYMNLLKKKNSPIDWDRPGQLHGNKKNGCVDISKKQEFFRNLSLLVAFRDEYGHSEFDEEHICRAQVREKYYQEFIITAEIEMLRNSLATILYLTENHPDDLKKI